MTLPKPLARFDLEKCALVLRDTRDLDIPEPPEGWKLLPVSEQIMEAQRRVERTVVL